MSKTQVVAVRMSAELLERIDAVAKNRSHFLIEAAEAKLNPVKSPDLSSSEKREVLKDTKTITEIMRDAMIQRLQTERGLLDSMPRLSGESGEDLKTIRGTPPDLRLTGKCCNFYNRCRYATKECETKVPTLTEIEPGHFVACLRQTRTEKLNRE